MPMSNTADMRRYRLLLINPYQKYKHYATQPQMCRLMDKRTVISPLALTLLASLTPAHYEVRIVDEELETLPERIDADIVGITTLTNTIIRCYELADRFRAQGIPVVLGGPHVSFAVDEGLAHADSVVVGEAEGAWQRCLADFEAGRLQPTYETETPSAFTTSPLPRWELVNTRKVLSIPIQVTRGCPYDCEFCVVTKMFGRKMRYRALDDVIAEVKASPLRSILFVDDNLTINKKYARELMTRLKPLGVSWTCQASLDLAKDPELLREMAAAGCEHIIIGFESLNADSLETSRKFHNRVDEYRKAVETIHAAGIMIFASFIVGFDNDTLDECDNIAAFAQDAPIPYLMLNLLGSAPGTDLQRRLTDEGRWYGPCTDFMGGIFPVMHYMQFSQTELYERYLATVTRAYEWPAIRERVVRLFGKGYFTRTRRGSDFGPLFKLWMLLRVVGLYLLSADRDKRRLFFELFSLARRGTVSFDKAVGVMVAMEGFHRHLDLLRRYRTAYAPLLARADKGAWRDMQGECLPQSG
ncbi:MAG: radical SAM protein [Chitinivibrionales bacterium]|nr:radical SAM protein [Chitinivibrionales bacterium]